MPTIIIDLSAEERFEAGSTLLSHLAYPLLKEQQEARDLHDRALRHAVLKYRAQHDLVWASGKQLLSPSVAFVTEAEMQRAVRQSRRRLRDRNIAGRIAVALMSEAKRGVPPPLPEGMKRLSLNQLAEYVMPDSGETEPANVIKRAWRPSLPVIHLAAAFEIYMRMADDRRGRSSEADVQHVAGAIEDVLEMAEEHIDLLRRNGRVQIREADLIRFELRK